MKVFVHILSHGHTQDTFVVYVDASLQTFGDLRTYLFRQLTRQQSPLVPPDINQMQIKHNQCSLFLEQKVHLLLQ